MPDELFIAVKKDLSSPDYWTYTNWKREHGIKGEDRCFFHLSNPSYGNGDGYPIEGFQVWSLSDLNLFLLTHENYRRYDVDKESYIYRP